MPVPSVRQLLPAACCMTLLFAVLLWPLPNTYRAAWVANLLDLSHIPLLAGVTIALFAASGGRAVWACGLGVALAAAGEAGQFLVGREPGWLDLAHGLAGVLLAGAALAVWKRPRSRWRGAIGLAAAATVGAWVMYGYAPLFFDTLLAYRAFPALSDFRSPWEPQRWFTQRATVERVRGSTAGAGWVGEVRFLPAEGLLSGIVLCPIIPDWSGYRSLHCDLSCREELPRLMLSVRDGRKVKPPQRRFEFRTRIEAGRHRLVLDLRQLQAGGEFAALDLSRIQSLHLCLEEAARPHTLIIHQIWLE